MITILAFAIPMILGLTSAARLRAAQSDQAFEVASVRRVEIPPTDRGVRVFPVTGGVGTSDPRRIAYRATWLKSLIAEAFNVRGEDISAPDWTNIERYDITANIPEGATKDQFKRMLGNLLVDRFGLRFHMGSHTRPVYALRLGKNGPKLKPTARRTDDTTTSKAIGAPDEQGCPVLPANHKGMVGLPGAGGATCWTAQDVTMSEIVRLIEAPSGRPIVDETGLTGGYDFKIRFQSLRGTPAAGLASDPIPTIFNAVEEQLGLKLESATGSFPQLIVDAIQREPTEN